MTKTDVDEARHHFHKPQLDLIGEKPTNRPQSLEEEHTNVIPHIPNYWTPSETNSIKFSGKKNYFISHYFIYRPISHLSGLD